MSPGVIKRQEVYERIAAARCQLAFLPSVCPESFMFTLSIVMASGLYTVCFDLGAQASRLRDGAGGRSSALTPVPKRSTTACWRQRDTVAAAAVVPSPPPPARYADVSRFVLRLLRPGAGEALSQTAPDRSDRPGRNRTWCEGMHMHVFTSVTANYLPKASALAHSVKRVHPEAVFHVVLSDEMPDCSARDDGPVR